AAAAAPGGAAPAGGAHGRHRRRGAQRRHRQPLPLLGDRPPAERARQPAPGRLRRSLLRLHRRRLSRHLGARLRPGLLGGAAARNRVLPRRRLRALLPGHRALQRRVPPPLQRRRRRGRVRQLPPCSGAPLPSGVRRRRRRSSLHRRRRRHPGLGDGVPVDLASCFLTGESAGANIVHHVASRWAAEHQPAAKSLRLAGIIPVQPYFGGEERTESELRLEGVAPVVNLERSDFSWKAFLPVGATRDHPAAHVTDENAELADDFPPTLLVIGGFDPLQDWQRRYADVLRRKGVKVQVAEYPDGFHGFYGFP
ncbi:hypothetical protein CFC21_022207, partial [Triticum aestivum]